MRKKAYLMKWSIEKTIIGGFGLTLVLLGVVTWISYGNNQRVIKASEWTKHTYNVRRNLYELISKLKDIETTQRGYVITGDKSYLQAYTEAITAATKTIAAIKNLTSDNINQQRRVVELNSNLENFLAISDRNIDVRKNQVFNLEKHQEITAEEQDALDEVLHIITDMQDEENILLSVRTEKEDESFHAMTKIVALTNIFTFLLIPITAGIIYKDSQHRQKIEKALRTSEERFAGILDIAQEAIISLNEDLEITLFNQGAEQIFGYRSEEVLYQSLDLLLPENLKLNYRQYIRDFVNDELNRPNRVENWGQIQVRKKSAKLLTAEASVSKITVEETHIITLVIRDITSRQEAEIKLASANEQLTKWVNELETYNQQLNKLSTISETLQACLNLEEVYHVIAKLVPPLFSGVSGALYIMRDSKDLLQRVATWGNCGSQEHFKPYQCWGLRLSKTHLITNPDQELICDHFHDYQNAESGCIPIMNGGELLGLLLLSSQNSQELDTSKIVLARNISEQIALALSNLKLREKLRTQSIRDGLTGLFNRRYLEESLQKEITIAETNHQPLAVIMLDVDHFKRFNDTYGHEGGDVLLKELGMFIRNTIRPEDIACRYGGEEFTILLPNTNLEEAEQIGEKLRLGVKHLDLRYRQQLLGSITLSLGLAVFPTNGTNREVLVQAADMALYEAKHTGRDRLVKAAEKKSDLSPLAG